MTDKTMTLDQVRACIDVFKAADLNVARQAVLGLAEAYARHLSQPAERVRVPEGYVLVPRQPTPEQIDAMKDAWWRGKSSHVMSQDSAKSVYDAMLSAAPSTSQETTP